MEGKRRGRRKEEDWKWIFYSYGGHEIERINDPLQRNP